MEVEEAEVIEGTKPRVLLGAGMLNGFDVMIGLRQGCVIIPVLFNVVMELISRKMLDVLGRAMVHKIMQAPN